MGRGTQSVQEMKACSCVLLPVHTRVACVCACTWMCGVWLGGRLLLYMWT